MRTDYEVILFCYCSSSAIEKVDLNIASSLRLLETTSKTCNSSRGNRAVKYDKNPPGKSPKFFLTFSGRSW